MNTVTIKYMGRSPQRKWVYSSIYFGFWLIGGYTVNLQKKRQVCSKYLRISSTTPLVTAMFDIWKRIKRNTSAETSLEEHQKTSVKMKEQYPAAVT